MFDPAFDLNARSCSVNAVRYQPWFTFLGIFDYILFCLADVASGRSATAVLKGKVSTMNWCCDSYTRREAAMDGVSCNGRVFKYTIKEVAVGELPWRQANDEQSNEDEEPEEEASGPCVDVEVESFGRGGRELTEEETSWSKRE